MRDMARLTGRSLDAVRRYGRLGWFSMKDVSSVIRYTAAHMVLSDLEPGKARREGELEVDNVQQEARSDEHSVRSDS